MSLSNLSSSNSNGAFLDYGEFRSGVYIQTSNQILYFTDGNGNKVGYQWKGLLPHTTTTNDPNTDGGISDTAWCSIVGSGFIEKLSKEGIDLSWQAHLPTVEVSYNLPHKTLKIWEKGLNSTANDYWLYTDDGTVWNGVGVLGDIPDVPFKQIVPQNNVIEWSTIATEGQNQFTVPYEFTNISIFINGLLQNNSTGGYVVNGSTVTLNGSLKEGDDIHVIITNVPITNLDYVTENELPLPGTSGKIGLLNGGTVQNLQNFLSFDMFSDIIDNTGVRDSHDGIKFVCDLANELKLPIIQKTGIFRLGRGNGTGTIIYNYDLDLSGSEFIIDSTFTTYDGFTATNPIQPTTHDSSSVLVSLVNSSTTLNAQSAVIDGLSENTEWDGNTLFLQSNTTKLYKGRGEDVYWLHTCRLTHYGRMDNTFKYTTDSISTAITMKPRNNATIVKLPDIDFSQNVGVLQVFNFKFCTGYRIQSGRVKYRNSNNTHQTAMLTINYSDDIIVDGFSDVHPQYGFNGSTTGQTIYTNYTFNFYMVHNIQFVNCKAQGYGWGVVGGGYSWGITFTNCDLNRYDWHEAAFDYVYIDNCRIGNYGVVGTFCCSVWINNSIFVFGNKTQPEISNTNYHNCLVGTRPDYGGWADGNLYINNCEVDGYLLDSSSVDSGISLFKCMINSNSSIGNNSGYAVIPRFWIDIKVNGLKFNRFGNNVNNIIWNSSPTEIMYSPRNIHLENIDFNNNIPLSIQLERFTPEIFSNNTLNSYATKNHPFINLNGIYNILGLVFPSNDNTSYWNPHVIVSNLQNTRPDIEKPYISTAQRGKYDITNGCNLKNISTTYNNKYPSLGVIINICDSTVGDGTNTPLVIGSNTAFVDSWTASNSTFIGNYSSTTVTPNNTLLARFVKMNSCQVIDNLYNFVSTLKIATVNVPNAVETPVSVYAQSGAVLEFVQNASSVTTNIQFIASNTGNHIIPVYTTATSPIQYYTKISTGTRGNQVYISSLYTTADNITSINFIH